MMALLIVGITCLLVFLLVAWVLLFDITELLVVGIIFLCVFLLIALVVWIVLSRKYGESAVKTKIESHIKRNSEYRLFNSIILKTPDGTTQIDHVLISPYGVYVIETKHMSGWIFGDARQKRWTQTLYDDKYQFQNPIHQNYKHIKAVQHFLKVDSKLIFSIIVFTGDGVFMTDMPQGVVELHDLIPYLESRGNKIMSDEQFKNICRAFTDYTNNAPYTLDDHARNLKRNLEHPTCPKCGIVMVLRTARKGPDVGEQFWGCSNYPTCKVTKRIMS